MKAHRLVQLVLASGIAIAASAPAFSAPASPGERSERGEHKRMHKHHQGHKWMHGHAHHHRGPGAASLLRGIELSDEQKDKVFTLRHAAVPETRAAMKDVVKARKALRELSLAADFNEARAKELAQASADASARMTLLRIKRDRDILAVLTPEQRQQLETRAQRRDARRGGQASNASATQAPANAASR